MTKRLDPDIKALRALDRALNLSSSERMAKLNAWWLWDRIGRPEFTPRGMVTVPREAT
ncbi:hypothetical protein LCGC14_1103970 [marine sediment metagenome]|uniref:Uncharacterized protein n=1 Tax=marine sediment metagenome TaxID=412755 RepID=A0A0F9MDA7_9ZZZZ